MIRYSGRVRASRRRTTGSRWRSSASPRRSATICSIAKPGPAIYEPWGRNYRGRHVPARPRRAGGQPKRTCSPRSAARCAPTIRGCPSSRRRRCTRSTIGASSCGPSRRAGACSSIFGLLALLLAVVGLYGVKSYVVSQRTREIGIRMALGARPGDVLSMMLKEGAALAAVGVALGLPLAALLGVALSSLLYDVKPLDPVVFIVGARRARAGRAGRDLARPPRPRLPALRADCASRRLTALRTWSKTADGCPGVAHKRGRPLFGMMRGCDGSPLRRWRRFRCVPAVSRRAPAGAGPRDRARRAERPGQAQRHHRRRRRARRAEHRRSRETPCAPA